MKTLKLFTALLMLVLFASCNSTELREENQTRVFNCLITRTITTDNCVYDGINATNAEAKFIGDSFVSFEITDKVKIEGYADTKLKTSIISQRDGVYKASLIYTYNSDKSTAYIKYNFVIVDDILSGSWEEIYPNSGIKNFGNIVTGQLVLVD